MVVMSVLIVGGSALAGCGGGSSAAMAPSTYVLREDTVVGDTNRGMAIERGGNRVELGDTASVPAGFPAEVPLPDGTVSDASSGVTGALKIYRVTVYVTDGERSLDALADGLETNGFAATIDPSGDGEGRSLTATSGSWSVLATLEDNATTGASLVSLLVTSR
jgi:hypothetical protein